MENYPPAGNQPPSNPFQQHPRYGGQMDVPNATATLVLGICSIVLCGLGPILGTIALVLGSSGKRAYEADPGMYREGSYKNLNAGRICGIIGICLGGFNWLMILLMSEEMMTGYWM